MIPSGLRLVPLYDGMPQPCWSSKDPANIGVFGADFSRVMRGGSIKNAVALASPPVVPMLCSVGGSIVSVVLSGGVDGQNARVEVTAIFEDGQTDTWAVLLPIIARGTLENTSVATSPTTTPDATPALIATIPVIGTPGSAVDIGGRVLARNVVTGEAMSWEVSAVVENVGTQQATAGQPTITAPAAPPSLAGCSLTLQVGGAIITIWATGLAGTPIVWTPNLQTTVA